MIVLERYFIWTVKDLGLEKNLYANQTGKPAPVKQAWLKKGI